MMLVQFKGPPTGKFETKLPCGWKSHGAAGRDIWSGVRSSKGFLGPPSGRVGQPVAACATVWRICLIIQRVVSVTEVSREDVVEAAERIAGAVERTPLIETRDRGRHAVAEMRVPADRRRVQAARRDQPAAAARRRGAASAAWSLSRRAIMRAGVAIAARRLGIPAIDRHAGRRAGGEGRGDARPKAPRSSSTTAAARAARRLRRGIAGESGRDGGAELRRSDDRRRAGHGRAGDRSSSCGGEPPTRDRRSVRRRRAGGGDRAGLSRRARSSCVEPEGWDDMRRSLDGGRDRAGRAPMRRRPCATRCRPRACRRSPSTSCGSAARRRWRSARPRSRTRCASPGASIS